MESLEDKLELIEKKVQRLIEQNAQYRRVCGDLMESKRKLESENAQLKAQLKSQSQPSEEKTQQETKPKVSALPSELDGEHLKKQLDRYIAIIDDSIKWLSDL